MRMLCRGQSVITSTSNGMCPLFVASEHQQSCNDGTESTSQIGDKYPNVTREDHESPSSTVDEHKNGNGRF